MPIRLTGESRHIRFGYPVEKKVQIFVGETLSVDFVVNGETKQYEIVCNEEGIFLHKKRVQRIDTRYNGSFRD